MRLVLSTVREIAAPLLPVIGLMWVAVTLTPKPMPPPPLVKLCRQAGTA